MQRWLVNVICDFFLIVTRHECAPPTTCASTQTSAALPPTSIVPTMTSAVPPQTPAAPPNSPANPSRFVRRNNQPHSKNRSKKMRKGTQISQAMLDQIAARSRGIVRWAGTLGTTWFSLFFMHLIIIGLTLRKKKEKEQSLRWWCGDNITIKCASRIHQPPLITSPALLTSPPAYSLRYSVTLNQSTSMGGLVLLLSAGNNKAKDVTKNGTHCTILTQVNS